MNIIVDNLMYNKNIDDIQHIIDTSHVNYISTSGTISKKGFSAYQKFMKGMEERKYFEANDVKKSTVFERIKRLEGVKDGI